MFFKSFAAIPLLTLAASASVVPFVRRTLDDQVVQDIAALNASATAAIGYLNALPDTGATWNQAENVVASVWNLALGFQVTSTDVNNSVSTAQYSQEDSQAFLDNFGPVVPWIVETLGLLTSKRDAFDDLDGFPNSILLDVTSFNTYFAEFEGSVVAAVPAQYTDIFASFDSVEGSIQTWIDNAIAAYSS